MHLTDCIITAAARCAPPKNKPTPKQLKNCFPYLVEEIAILQSMRVVVGLGSIGFNAAVNALKSVGFVFNGDVRPKFGHAAEYRARYGERMVALLGSYHPSRQNTNTGVLTAGMLDSVLTRAKYLANHLRAAKPISKKIC
jgi:uracil-DNA glycosylase family 4